MYLAVTYPSEIDERLPGVAVRLTQDLEALGVAIPGVVQKRNEAVAATTAQNARVRQGHARVRAVRSMVRKAKAPKDVQRAYGVGQRASTKEWKGVAAALQQIVDRATSHPEEAAAFGLGAAAVAQMTSFLAALTEENKTQEAKRADAPLSTKERNMVGNRVLQTVALIAGAGMLAFADNPRLYASFDALLAGSKKGKAKEKKADAPKADAPKADAPKADAPKADAPKAAPPKPAALKATESPAAEAAVASEEAPVAGSEAGSA